MHHRPFKLKGASAQATRTFSPYLLNSKGYQQSIRMNGIDVPQISSEQILLVECQPAARARRSSTAPCTCSSATRLLLQPPALQPRSKAVIDAELAAERDW